jgi:hypothetical protein
VQAAREVKGSSIFHGDETMNAILRNSLLAVGVAGSLTLAACKTDESMESTPPPAEPAPPVDTMPPPPPDATMPPAPTPPAPPADTMPPTPPTPPTPPAS